MSLNTVEPITSPLALGTLRPWYRDTVSCLHSTVGALLGRTGADPLAELGLGWEFLHLPGDVRPEEYYWPCRHPGDLVRSLLPHHPGASSAWRALPPDPLGPLEQALAEGRWPVVAVDNFHLPFRPAYRDVHAAHLILVCAIDRAAGTAWVSDAMPPEHHGPLSLDALAAAVASRLDDDVQDAFFTGGGTARGRWLDVRLDPVAGPLDPDRLRAALEANLRGLRTAPHEAVGRPGLAGLDAYLTHLTSAAADGSGRDLVEAYTFGWSAQAAASVHGELLRRLGADWSAPALAEAGRRVESVSHAWTPVRIACAHGRNEPAVAARVLGPAADRLRSAYAAALGALDTALAALPAAGSDRPPGELP